MDIFSKVKNIIPLKAFLIAVFTGLISLFSIYIDVHFYIPGTNVLSDAREIFNSLGAAITGPIGGFIIGTISCLISPTDELRFFIIFQHWMSAIWIGWAYKKLVYEKMRLPKLAVGWILLIIIYYGPTYLPGYFITYLFFPDLFHSLIGGNLSPFEGLLKLYKGWLPEIIFTSIYTTLVIVALPDSYRKPRWGKPNLVDSLDSAPGFFQAFLVKYFNRNYLALRLSIWFILLFTIPLIFISLFTRNHFLEYFLKAESIQQTESVERIFRMTSLSTNDSISIFKVIDEVNKTGLRTVLLLDDSCKVKYGVESSKNKNNISTIINNGLRSRILIQRDGIYIDNFKGSAIAFRQIKTKNSYLVSFSPPGKYNSDLNEFANLITRNLGITLLVISFISGLIIWLLIGRPLKRLTNVTERIGKGDYLAEAKHKDMTDEVLVLATSIDEMKDNIKNSQLQLEKSESKFRTLFETANDAIIIIDNGVIIDCNKKTEELFRRTRDEIIKRTVLEYSPSQQSNGELSSLVATQKINAALSGTSQFFEWDLLAPNGDIITTEISLNRILLVDNYFVQSIIRDISERKRYELNLIFAKNEAEKADRMKSEFLAQISHEIRTPIHIIEGNLSIIKEILEESSSTEINKYLNHTKNASNRIIRTIELIIKMSEIKAGTYQPIFCSFNLVEDILQDLIPEFSVLAQQKNLTIEFYNQTNGVNVYCDKNNLEIIVSNLIDNAIKFTDKGKIEIMLTKYDDNSVLIKVADTGCGISKEYLPDIFNSFSQETQGINRTFDGNGLGLAIVKSYCESNCIKILVETEKGIGSTFSLVIPKANI